MTALQLAVDTLATARIARLVTTDTLPPLQRARERLYQALPPEWAHGVHCTWCVSVWAGTAVALARHAAPRAWGPVGYALALGHLVGAAAAAVEQQNRDSAAQGGVVG